MIQHCKCNHSYVPQERITLQLTMGVFHLENECLALSSSDFLSTWHFGHWDARRTAWVHNLGGLTRLARPPAFSSNPLTSMTILN